MSASWARWNPASLLSALQLSVALRRHGITTTLLAGDATPAGLGLAARHGLPAAAFRVSRNFHRYSSSGSSPGEGFFTPNWRQLRVVTGWIHCAPQTDPLLESFIVRVGLSDLLLAPLAPCRLSILLLAGARTIARAAPQDRALDGAGPHDPQSAAGGSLWLACPTVPALRATFSGGRRPRLGTSGGPAGL